MNSRSKRIVDSMYGGFFYSVLDYQISVTRERFSQIKEKVGMSLDATDLDIRERLHRLDELGGPRKWQGNRELTPAEMQELVNIGEDYKKTYSKA